MSAVRGEARLDLADKPVLLRPTFAALVEAEEELGSLFALVEKAARGALRLTEIISLLWFCCTERDRLERAAFSQQCLDLGLAGLTPVLRLILQQILAGK